ncbi:MAG: lipopolysaccharide biosynthesis protein, partial [Planctomycetota bacterium]
MIEQIVDLIKTRTARHTFTLFIGNAASKGLALFILFALAHFLDRQDYELIGMAMTIVWLVYEFTELGMNRSLVRHAAEHVEANRFDRAAGLFRFTATVKIVLWAGVFLAGWLASPTIAEYFLGGRGETGIVLLALAGGVGLGGIVFLDGIFYSHKQFYKQVLVSVSQNLLKLAAILFLAVLAKLSLDRVMAVYALAPWGAIALGVFLIPKSARRWGRMKRSDLTAVSRFGLLFAAIVVLASLENRLGIFLLKRLAPCPGEVADFFLAQQLSMIFMFFLWAYSNVMISKISSVGEWREVVRIQKKSLLPLGVLAGGVGLLIVGAGILVHVLLPARYAGTVPAARWLFLSVIFSILGTPATMAILYVKRLRVFLFGHLAAVSLMIVLCFLWIPVWGSSGLAAAFTLARGLYYLVNTLYFLLAMGTLKG